MPESLVLGLKAYALLIFLKGKLDLGVLELP